ncbi:hypothetical protein [Streptomyces sp. HPF1205]|uniref:hypothetical protein n=1 Tax=Streptomyces sp. HPF1205 TaxID=2873262 RepID=UPI001CEDD2F6|nr:hypothetical protein [Streptomyces sp. HPF1205]
MRLLRAELMKLNRPLTWAVFAAAALFCVLLAVGGASNARTQAQGGGRQPASCATLRLPAGPDCVRALDAQRARAAAERTDEVAAATRTAAQLGPVAAGAEAAGLMASLPGALALALLAGGHVGGEWSGRTVKNLLVQNGRRARVLAAKAGSLWLAGVGLVLVCWAALAVAGPLIRAADGLPDPHESLGAAASWAFPQAGRSLLVLAAFAAMGVLAGVVTRGTIGTMAATTAAVVAMLIATTLPGLGRWTPATWVQGWMGFAAGQASITSLPDNFWSRFNNSTGAQPGHLTGLAGVSGLLAVCVLAAMWLFRTADVTG